MTIENTVVHGQQTRVSIANYMPHLFPLLFRLADGAVVIGVGLALYVTYVSGSIINMDGRYVAALLVGAVVSATVLQRFKAYDLDALVGRYACIDKALSAWAVTFALLLLLAFGLKISDVYSRVWTVAWFVGSGALLVVVRLVAGHWLMALVREGHLAKRTVILGAGEYGQRLAAQFGRSKDFRTMVLGFIDDRDTRVPRSSHGLEIIGNTRTLMDMIRSNLIDQVVVALPWDADNRLRALVRELSMTPVQICLAPYVPNLEVPNRQFTQIANVPMLELFQQPISGWSSILKVIEDRAIAALLILFTAPLLTLIGLAIKLDSSGPVFFRQTRQGYNNSLIKVWKFRTMYTNMTDAHCAVQTTKGDPRVTRIGKFLRKSSLDELPQLFNVLFGTMSMVGPRPHALETKAEGRVFTDVVDRYAARHRVKPGITGWAQVNGWRGETDTVDKIKKRVEYDLYYIDNWSLWLDFYIIARTIWVVFKDNNAY